ncbi:MAG: hypothetical protein IJV16_05900 [Lachnospiraceae bacterium]|nr:hypothetical protein [Lachnospiraceae bacterium]
MRHRIDPGDFRGAYYDEIRAEDLIVMGECPQKTAGTMRLGLGIYGSLWRLSLETGLGMVIDIRRIPLEQSYIDNCNRRDINPYEQPLEKDLYIVHPVSSYHLQRGISVIGYLTKDKVCRILNGERESFLGS